MTREGAGSMLVSAGAVNHYLRYNPGMCLEGKNCSWSLAPHQLSLRLLVWWQHNNSSQASCAMAQVVSHQPLATQAWVQSQVSPCRVCGGQGGTRTGFLWLLQVSLSASFHQCCTHTHSFKDHWHYIILATDRIVKWHQHPRAISTY